MRSPICKQGTPHTYHYSTAKSAILAKKHILLEKPVTSNAAELRTLISLAKEHSVFLMEAMWTRFQPVAKAVRALIDGGSLGDPVIVHADLSGDFDIDSEWFARRCSSSANKVAIETWSTDIPHTHRILDPRLGGGAILDL